MLVRHLLTMGVPSLANFHRMLVLRACAARHSITAARESVEAVPYAAERPSVDLLSTPLDSDPMIVPRHAWTRSPLMKLLASVTY